MLSSSSSLNSLFSPLHLDSSLIALPKLFWLRSPVTSIIPDSKDRFLSSSYLCYSRFQYNWVFPPPRHILCSWLPWHHTFLLSSGPSSVPIFMLPWDHCFPGFDQSGISWGVFISCCLVLFLLRFWFTGASEFWEVPPVVLMCNHSWEPLS